MTRETDRAAQRALVERFVRARPGSMLFDPAGPAVLDVSSGKVLPLDLAHVAAVEERTDAQTGRPYLAIARDDGVELALADAGVAFAPRTEGTGPLEGLPPAVCFQDLSRAEGQLRHFLQAHPGEPPERGHVALFLFCLALVDGARAVGFDVAPEERRLDALLAELEVRRRG
jgi:hypothetical protein